jgi:23S rRNA (adenine2503-C2)-methyltransferase
MDAGRPSLLDLSRDELVALLAAWNEPAYRAGQIREWLFKKAAADASQMSSLPQRLRARLGEETDVFPLTAAAEQHALDGETTKWLFRLADGQTIETVLMRYEGRTTVCISSQAGCAMACVFCATGMAGLARNLTAGEIVAQVLYAQRQLMLESGKDERPAAKVTNIVIMGMGEPLANYERTWQALGLLTDPAAFNLGARHITLSTVGLPPGIRRMAEEPLQINLAVSLHAPDDALRQRLVPINRRYPLSEVMAAVKEYIARTNRRVTFEYALMDGINDTPQRARQLGSILRALRSPTGAPLSHVNLIPLNPVAESPYQPSTLRAAEAFQEILEQSGVPATVRLRRGIDIDAGCGQLRRRAATG